MFSILWNSSFIYFGFFRMVGGNLLDKEVIIDLNYVLFFKSRFFVFIFFLENIGVIFLLVNRCFEGG